MLVRVAVCLSVLFAVGLGAPKPSEAPTAATDNSATPGPDHVTASTTPSPSESDPHTTNTESEQVVNSVLRQLDAVPDRGAAPQGGQSSSLLSMLGGVKGAKGAPPQDDQGMSSSWSPFAPMNGQGMPPINGQDMPPMSSMGFAGSFGTMRQAPTGVPPTAEQSDATKVAPSQAPFPGFLPPELLNGLPMDQGHMQGMPGPTALPMGPLPPAMMRARGPMPPFNRPPPPFPQEMPPPTMMPTSLLRMFGPDRGDSKPSPSMMDQGFPKPTAMELPDILGKFLVFEQKIQMLSQEILDSFHRDLVEYLVLSDAYKGKMRSKLQLLSVLQERLAAPTRQAMASMATFNPLLGPPSFRDERHLVVVGATSPLDSAPATAPSTSSPTTSAATYPASKATDQRASAMMEQQTMMAQMGYLPMMGPMEFPPMMGQGQPLMMGRGQPPMMGPLGFPPMLMAQGQAPMMSPEQNESATGFPPTMSPQEQVAMMAQMGYPPMMSQGQVLPMMQRGQIPQDQSAMTGFPPTMSPQEQAAMMDQMGYPPMMQQGQFPMMPQGQLPPMMMADLTTTSQNASLPQGFPPTMSSREQAAMMAQMGYPPMMPQGRAPPMMQRGQVPPMMPQGRAPLMKQWVQVPLDMPAAPPTMSPQQQAAMMAQMGYPPMMQQGQAPPMMQQSPFPMMGQDQAATMAQMGYPPEMPQGHTLPMMSQGQVSPMTQWVQVPLDMPAAPPTMSPQQQAAMMAQMGYPPMMQQGQAPSMMQQSPFPMMDQDQSSMMAVPPTMPPQGRLAAILRMRGQTARAGDLTPEMMARMQAQQLQLQQQFDTGGQDGAFSPDTMKGGFLRGVPTAMPMMAGGQNAFATGMPQGALPSTSASPSGKLNAQASGNMIIRLLALQQSASARDSFNPAAN